MKQLQVAKRWPEGRRCGVVVALLAVLVGTAALTPAQDFKIEPSPSLDSTSLSQTLAAQLDPKGSRLVRAANGAHNPICDVWWVKSVDSGKPAGTTPDILYGSLPVGGLVGVLQAISPEAEDFRDQKLKPGLYTMRYAQIPQDGNHMGVSQFRDFLLLIPARADTQPDKVLGFDELVKLSRLATGTGHPAVMSLVPPNPSYKKLPAVVADDQGNCALQVQVHERSPAGTQDADLAILLITPPKEEGGS